MRNLKKDIFFILLFCLFVHAEQSNLYSFYYKGEKIEVCHKGCPVKYEKQYENVLLRHEGTTVYLIGDGRDVIRFLYDSGFQLEKLYENKAFVDGLMVKTKNYTYKLNKLFATNFEYNLYLEHPTFFGNLIPQDFLEALKKDNKKMVFTIAPKKVIRIIK